MTAAASTRKPRPAAGGDTQRYFHQSQLPLASLLFLLPLILIYEIGVQHFYSTEIVASRLIRDFFHLFGATGHWLPAMAVVGILLAWHIARNDPWRIRPAVIGSMFVESAALVLPVLLLFSLTRRYLLANPAPTPALGGLVLSLGAGIYEELVFRLIAFTLLNLLLVDALKVPKRLALPLIVVIPAVLFSLYHYLGDEAFHWQTVAFRTAAGCYFGFIFLYRGFGITSGTHAAYDIVAILLSSHP